MKTLHFVMGFNMHEGQNMYLPVQEVKFDQL